MTTHKKTQQEGLGRRSFLTAGAAMPVIATSASLSPANAAPPEVSVPVMTSATDLRTTTVTPETDRYSDFIRGNNQRWVATPEAVILPTTTRQVVAAVQRAVDEDKRLTVRSGGHCYEDFVYSSDTEIVIDLSEMHDVGFDRSKDAFYVEPGATVLNVVSTLYRRWGVTVPVGMCYSVGMGGHITGGGWGLLCRLYGLSVDHLDAIEVVVVGRDGRARAVRATRDPGDPHHDLWWAHTGGGGGSFGIVTKFWFRTAGARGEAEKLLPRPPAEVYVHVLAWPWADMTKTKFSRLLHNYGTWHAQNSRPDGEYDGLMSFLALGHRSNGQLSLLTQLDATQPNSLDRLHRFISTINDGVEVEPRPMTQSLGEFGPMAEHFTAQRMPWLQATILLGVTNPTLANPALRGDSKSAYMRADFPENHIAALYKHLTREDFTNPNALVVASSYGGQVNAVESSATATSHRDSIFKVLYQSHWATEAEDEANIAWLRDIYSDVYQATGGVPIPNTVTSGCLVNYADIDLNDKNFNTSGIAWSELYFGENYERLQTVKGKWDPKNLFWHGQSIRPPRS